MVSVSLRMILMSVVCAVCYFSCALGVQAHACVFWQPPSAFCFRGVSFKASWNPSCLYGSDQTVYHAVVAAGLRHSVVHRHRWFLLSVFVYVVKWKCTLRRSLVTPSCLCFHECHLKTQKACRKDTNTKTDRYGLMGNGCKEVGKYRHCHTKCVQSREGCDIFWSVVWMKNTKPFPPGNQLTQLLTACV